MTVNKELLNLFMGNILKNPNQLYYLLMLAGYNGIDARKLIWDIQYARIRTADPKVRAKVLKFLTNLIETLTNDKILYSRMISMGMNKNLKNLLSGIREDVSYGVPVGQANAVAMGSSSLQGVLGTNLGIPFSGGSTNGIDGYDNILGSLLRRQNIKTKNKKKKKRHKKIKFPM